VVLLILFYCQVSGWQTAGIFFLYFALLQKLISSGVASYVLGLGVTHAPGTCSVADVASSTMSHTRQYGVTNGSSIM
jgi:hypothetical protein